MLKFIVLTLFAVAHSFTTPIITSVEQLTENSIRIKWKFGNEPHKKHFTRYRIQYSTDYFENEIGEWPAQASLITTDTNGQILNITTTQSNLECFNECIKTPQCVTATKLPEKIDNCLMKSNHDRLIVSPLSNQVVRVNDYRDDEAVLFNLPYDQIYSFRVALYDQDAGRWTLFSDPSDDELNMKINLQISLERVDYSTLRVKWQQIGNFTNYKLSRFVVKISTNDEPFETKHDISKLISTTIDPSYFELPLSGSIGVFLTESDCFNKCRNMLNCVQYVFYTNNGSCHLADRYNPLKGFKDQGVVSKFIQSTSNEFLLEDLTRFVNYKIQVEYLTPFGTNGTSNLASYVLTNLKPILRIKAENDDFTVTLNWTVVEPVRLRTYQIYFSINESNYFNEYFESNLIDFEDPFEFSFSSSLTECFNKCVANSTCLAFSWHKFKKICTFKATKIVSKACDPSSFCSSILDYSSEIKIKSHYVNTKYCYMISVLSDFGFIGDKSNQACFKWNATVSLKAESLDFIENESTSFRCLLNGLAAKQVETISWYRNEEKMDEKMHKNLVISNREMRLKLFELSHKSDDGSYYCGLTLKNGQQIFSNKIDLRVKFGPVIKFNTKNERALVVNETSDVRLVCKAEGYPIPEVKFMFNGNPMVNFESKYDKYSKEIWANLKNVTKKYNGTYSCYLNEAARKSIDMIIRYGPIMISEPKNLTVDEFESVNLICSIEKYPAPNIIWKNLVSNELVDQNLYTYINSKTVALIFDRANRNHSGRYACFDEENPNLAVEFGVFVKFPSHFVDQSRTIRIEARENSSVDMNCTAVGYPLPAIEWKSLRTDQMIMSNWTQTTDKQTTSYLTLRNLLKNDAGNYSCAIPDLATERIIFSLNILTKPNRPIIVEIETVTNDRIRIVWCIDDIGNSPLTHGILEWSVNFTNTSGVDNHTVTFEPNIIDPSKNLEIQLSNISIDDESFIRLSVRNAIGRSEPSGPFKLVKRAISMKIKASFVTATLISILSVAALALIFSTIIFTIKLNKFWRNDRRFDQDSRCKLNMSMETVNKKNLKLLNHINTFGAGGMDASAKRLAESFSMANLESRLNLAKSLNSISSNSCSKKKTIQQLERSSPPILPPNTESIREDLEPAIDPHVYDRQALLKRFTEDFYTLDKDMHFEFNDIKNPDNKTFYDSLKMQNERKSRYKHVYPYDDNRVKLSLIPGRPDSDFINASYITTPKGFNKPRKFIAAQGPTRETASDFLRMLVEKEIKVIVMLTQIYEGDPPMLKCWPYWNDNNVIKFGTYTSEVKSKENKVFYEQREIEIKNNEVQLTINHYYYKEWPDKLCPIECQSIIDLIYNINLEYSDSESPILVHCSAGIGRTGSFIAICNLIDSIRESNQMNPYQAITEMRKQRPHLVQNWEQYKYIHQTLLEWSLFEWSSIDLNDRDYVDSLLLNHRAKIENEFGNINLLKDKLRLKTYSYDFLIKKDLSQFNLSEQILSVEKTLDEIKLVLKDVLQVKIPTLKCDFLLTIEPNSKTINEFLTFLVKTKPISIVSFSPFETAYLKELSNLGNLRNFLACGISVKCTDVTTSESLSSPLDLHRVYDIEFTDTKNNNQKFSTRYYTSSKLWQIVENLGSSEDYESILPDCEPISYLRFVNQVLGDLRQRLSMPNFSKPSNHYIVLQSNDHNSYEKCAIFMCVYYLLLSMHVKRRFDVVHIVRLLRKNYSKFISKLEHYIYLYELCGCRHVLDLIRRD